MQACYFLLLLAWMLLTATSTVVNGVYLRKEFSDEERVFDAKKIDALINPAAISSALTSPSKQEKLFTTWAKNSAVSDDVVKVLSKDPAKNEKVLQAFQAHNEKVDKLATSQLSKLKSDMTDKAEQQMFKSWFENEAVSDAIVKKLSKHFKKNEYIILAYNDYRTLRTYGKTFGEWLRMSDLKAISKARKEKDYKKMDKIYGKWFAQDQTVDDLKNALKGEILLKFQYNFIFKGYDNYIKKIDAKVAKLAGETS